MTAYNPDDLLAILTDSEERLTARQYIRRIADLTRISTRSARGILKDLVTKGRVAYQDLYGSTYVMESFSKPVRITDRFFIAPPRIRHDNTPQAIYLSILTGISFGSGSHPTTRLCLEAMEHVCFTGPGVDSLPGTLAGDVGTGSGVLAIAACRGGLSTCLAWDIDPNAVSEARQNIRANGLTGNIVLEQGLMPTRTEPMALICANLRYPTLKDLAKQFRENLLPGGFLIVSGLRSWEKDDLTEEYRKSGLTPVWQKDLKHWTGMILHRD